MLSESYALRNIFAESLGAANRAVQLNPVLYPAWFFVANAHAGLGNWEACLAASERILQIVPGLPTAEWLRSHGLMAANRWGEAWQANEHGFVTGGRKPRCAGKQWHGDRIEGKTLFVWSEQGQGDAIQYSRFLKIAKERSGAHIIFECRPSLLALLEPLADVTLATGPDMAVTFAYDYHVPLMSLPAIMGLDTQDIDGAPYLLAQPVEDTDGKIGLCWKGDPVHGNDKKRSMPFEFVEQLKDFDLVSFQFGEDVEWLPNMCGGDFAQTARALSGLKMLITVDTALAHLAGALGVPTVVIAPLGHSEARWGYAGKTPWYKSWEIVHADNWQDVVELVQGAICQLIPSLTTPLEAV